MSSAEKSSSLPVFKGKKDEPTMDDKIARLSAQIKPIRRDKCILPIKISKELAEEFGIHVGDGYMRHKIYPKQTVYEYSISSGVDEINYIQGHIKPLMKNLYNLETRIQYKKPKEIAVSYKSKSLFRFKSALGLPNGRKDEIEMPEIILKSEFINDFLRGLFDTDGCLMFKDRNKNAVPYPRLDITGKSKKLICQVNEILLQKGFTTSLLLDFESKASNGTLCKSNRIFIYGKKNLKKWVELIGFSNPKNIRKFEEWKEKYSISW